MLLLFDLGGGEIMIVVLIVLLLFGSRRIPNLAQSLGKGIRMFRDATQGIQQDIRENVRDVKESVDDLTKHVENSDPLKEIHKEVSGIKKAVNLKDKENT